VIHDDSTEAQKKELAFPAIHKDLYSRFRKYMIFIARFGRRRSRAMVRISYRGIMKAPFWYDNLGPSTSPKARAPTTSSLYLVEQAHRSYSVCSKPLWVNSNWCNIEHS
jgi:hypothetical protein